MMSFRGIPMSTDVVTQMTVASALQQGLTTSLIDQLYDIDELPDLLRLAELLAVESSYAPATAAYLATMRVSMIYTPILTNYARST